MRPFAAFAFAGISGFVLWKLFVTMLFPLHAMILGLIALTAKIALMCAVIFLIFSKIRKRCDREAEA